MKFYRVFPTFAFVFAAVPVLASGLEKVDENPSRIQAVLKKKQSSMNIWTPNRLIQEVPSPEWVSLGSTNVDNCNSVSLSQDGRTVATGCRFYNNLQGRVFIHSLINNEWVEQTVFTGEASKDSSGWSVSLSADGSTVAIGAPYNDGNGDRSGHVRIYRYTNNGSWTQLGNDLDGEAYYDYSGTSVSLSADGNTVAIGATGNDGNGSSSGHVRVYRYANNVWAQLGNDLDGEAKLDNSGYSVSLSADGNTVAIGAPYNSANGLYSGHARVYRYANNAWTQLGNDLDGEAEWDYSGGSVSLSADGNTIAIGAEGNDGNGSDSGHVRVYRHANNMWTKLGNDLDGEASKDYSGVSVSLSADGNTVAIGAKAYVSIPYARVYTHSNNVWTQVGEDISGDNSYFAALSGDGNTLAAGANLYSLVYPSSSPSTSQMPSLSPSPSQMPSLSPSTSQMPSLSPSTSQMPSLGPSTSQMPSLSPSTSQMPSLSPSTSPSLSSSFNPSSEQSNVATLAEDQTEVTIEASTTLSTGNANTRRVDLATKDGDTASQIREIFEATLLTMFDVDSVEVTNVVCENISCDVDFIMTKIVECEGACTEDSIATLQNSFEQSMANELVTAMEDGTFTETFVASAESAGYDELTNVTGFSAPDFEFELTISPTVAPTSTSGPIIPSMLLALLPFVVGIAIAVITLGAVSSIGFLYWWWRFLPLPNIEGPLVDI